MNATSIIDAILKEDEVFRADMQKEHGAATFCPDCKKNIFIGRYPIYHTKGRMLCSKCGPEYVALLCHFKMMDSAQ